MKDVEDLSHGLPADYEDAFEEEALTLDDLGEEDAPGEPEQEA
jgi:hypothetical protein